jgi:hypothetical protein
MTTTDETTRWRFARRIILIGIVACLCFSVGEGLQLRPFPFSARAKFGPTNTQVHAPARYEVSFRKYGPLDVPTRAHNRGKREVVDCDNAPCQGIRELTTHTVLLPDAGASSGIVSLLLGPHLSGRAPPSDSQFYQS